MEREVAALTTPVETVCAGHERILFIDDEEMLAEMGEIMLERLGYKVTVRTSSMEALATFQNQPDQFDVVITDQTMPGLTGLELAQQYRQRGNGKKRRHQGLCRQAFDKKGDRRTDPLRPRPPCVTAMKNPPDPEKETLKQRLAEVEKELELWRRKVDNSERLLTEKALRRSRQLLDATQQLTHAGGWEWDIAAQTMTWTRETFRIHGLPEDEKDGDVGRIDMSLACYDAMDRARIIEAFRLCSEHGESYDLTLPFTSMDGRRLWIRTMGEAVWDKGRIVQVRGNIVDITNFKNNEELLKARLMLSEAAATASLQDLLLMTLDEAERLTNSRAGFFHFFDESRQTISLMAWSSTTARNCAMAEQPSSYQLSQAGCWAESIRRRCAVIHNDYAGLPQRHTLPPGHVELTRELVVPVLRNDQVVAVLGVGNKERDYQNEDLATVSTLANLAWDIVLRKRAEIEMQESEKRSRKISSLLRSVCDNVPDMIWAKDLEKRYIFTNKALCRDLLQAVDTDEPIGKNDLFFALRERNTHPENPQWHTFGELCRDSDALTMDAGEKCQFDEFGNVRGQFLFLDVHKAPFIDARGQVIGTVGSARDVTEHRQAVEALRHSLEEKKVLLREVHHRVKNNMAAIIGLFDMQRSTISDASARATLDELGFRVRAMSLVHEKLYRAESLSRIDFQEYCESLLSHLHLSLGSPQIQLPASRLGEAAIPLDLAVPCGMIINELATNALKYAFPAERRRPGLPPCLIRVVLRQTADTLVLTVADNGIGLPSDFAWSNATSLGLTLVRMLGMHQLGGTYEVERLGGTSFTLTFSPRENSKR
jgi:two-component sensor histidine kinase/PAS domain-containing protein